MAQTTPPSLTAPPTAPQTTDGRTLFASRSDAFVAWFATQVIQMTSAMTNVYNNAVDAFSSATSAATSAATATSSAAAASLSAGATAWVSGTTYSIGARVISPVNAKVYRRIVSGAGTTDPSVDAVNWASAEPEGAPGFLLQANGIT